VSEARALKVFVLVLAGFGLLFLNLVRMQVLSYERYHGLSEKNRIRVIYLEAARGRILDRRGRALATSRLSFNCTAVPREASRRIDESCRVLAPILLTEASALKDRFESGRSRGSFNTVIVAEDIPPAQAMAIEEKLDLLPGFMIETRPRRQYPYGESAAHLVGQEGIEMAAEEFLRGYSGGLQIEVNSRGRLVRALGVKEPKEGKDVQLTVDAELQAFVQGLLGGKKGAVMVMELGEGGLLSINSSPTYDSNLFASSGGRKRVGKYLQGEGSPMVNRGLRGQYPPGSIFKVVTALAAMKKRNLSPDRAIHCPGHLVIGGRRFPCWKESGHGPQTMSAAFAHSCNVYFYSLGLTAGIEALLEKTHELGFGSKTGVDLPGEKPGFVPSREWKRRRFGEGWFDGETANLSIGQGYLQVTPVQALGMIAATALDGRWLRPHAIESIHGVKVSERQSRPLPSAPAHWRAVRRGLEAVVESAGGTGRLSRVEGVRVAGKTGTAESGQDRTHAWFVGYAPAERPKVAMVVFLEHGGRGGVAAAAVAQEIFKWLKGASYL
jgi:penicillin-binding protein 2